MSPVSAGSHVYAGKKKKKQMFTVFPNNISNNSGLVWVFFGGGADNSIADQSDSMEVHSTDDVQPPSNVPAEQSGTKAASVSEAALQDGERKAQPGTPRQSPF